MNKYEFEYDLESKKHLIFSSFLNLKNLEWNPTVVNTTTEFLIPLVEYVKLTGDGTYSSIRLTDNYEELFKNEKNIHDTTFKIIVYNSTSVSINITNGEESGFIIRKLKPNARCEIFVRKLLQGTYTII